MALLKQGYCFIAGLDEAGRGCLAGPVVAAAVILPLEEDCLSIFVGVRDSKQLLPHARESLYQVIMQHAVAVGVGFCFLGLFGGGQILPGTKKSLGAAVPPLMTA